MTHSTSRLLLTLAATAATLMGCDDAASRAGAPTVRDSAGITILEHTGMPAELPQWTIAEPAELRLGARDGERPDVFGRIAQAVERSDGSIVVADALASEIKAFSANGTHLWTAGGAGGGPGEFSGQPSDVKLLPGDSVMVSHRGGQDTPIFDADGRYARTLSLTVFGVPEFPPEGVSGPPAIVSILGTLADGTIVGTPGAPMSTPLSSDQPGRVTYQVAYYDPAGQVRDTVGTFPLSNRVEHEGRVVTVGLSPSSKVAVGRDRFVVGLQDNFELRTFGPNASLTSILRVAAPAREIDERVRACYVEAAVAFAQTDQARVRMRQQYATRPLAATLPAFGQIHIDAANRLWVQEFVHPCESRQPRWWILDADGAWLAETSIPEGFRIVHIGADYITGIVRDEFDVEYVERRGIGGASADASRPEAPMEASLSTQGRVEQEPCVAIRASEINAVDAVPLAEGAALWTRGSDAQPLHQVSGARFLPNGRAVVLSGFGTELWIYDAATGDAVTQVGRSGDGPGEFREARDMNLLDNGRIAVLDRRNRRVVIFSPSGEPLETRPFPDIQGTFEGVMPEGSFLVALSGPPPLPAETTANRAVVQDRDHVLVAVGQDLSEDTVRSWTTRRVARASQRSAVPFQLLTSNEVVGQRVAWVEQTGQAVHTRSFAPTVRRCLRWDGPATPIGQEMRDSLLQDVTERAAARTDGGAWGRAQRDLLEAMFAQELVPPALPPFKSVDPAPDGTLWLTLGVPTSGVDPARPTAIQVSASGTVLRRVSLPHRSSIWTAGQDRLLVGWYGSDMEDWIGVFLLTPP